MSAFRDRPKNPHNVVDNSSFELGMKNWEVLDKSLTRTNCQIDETTAVHGKRSLKISRPHSSATTVSIRTQLMPIEEGKRYTLSLYAKSDEPATLDISSSSLIYSKEKRISINPLLTRVSLTNTWKRYEVPINNIKPYSIYGNVKNPGYYSISMSTAGKGALWLDAVQLEKGELTDYQLPSSVELGLSTNKMNNIFHPGEPISLFVNVFNAAEKTTSPVVSYKIADFERKIVKEGKIDFSLKKGEGKTKEIRLASQKGYFKLSAVIEEKTLPKKDAEISFGVISPLSNLNAEEDDFFAVSAISGSNFLLSMFEEMGLARHGNLYGSLYWANAPKNWKQHNPQWERADKLLSLMKKYNITPKVMLWGCPGWSGIKNKKPTKPEQVTDEVIQGWYDYTYEVVKRYKDRVKEWSIWMEFVHGPYDIYAGMYFKFLKSAYEAIKKADPEAIVVGCGEDSAHRWALIPQVEAHFKLGSLKYMDVVGIHPYSKPLSPEAIDYAGMIDKLKETIRKYNNGKEKPIWATEVGWQGLDTMYYEFSYPEASYTKVVTELAQADYIVRMNVTSLAKGVERFYTFPLSPLNIYRPYAYSLVNCGDYSPKIAYIACNNMVSNLRGAKFIKEIEIGENIRCHQFDKDSKPLLVIWNYDKSHKLVKLRVNLKPENLKITNMVGVSVSLRKGNKDTLLTITGSPLYIEGEKAGKASFIKAFQEAEVEKVTLNTRWGKENRTLIATLNNQGSQSLKGKVSLDVPSGWDLPVSAYSYKLDTGEKRDFKFKFKDIKFNPLQDTIKVKSVSEGWTVTAQLNPLPCFYTSKSPVIDGNLNDWIGAVPVELGINNLRNRFEASQWKGKKDLSAAVYTLWDEKYLYFGVEVTDNIFSSPYTGRMIWANDALQVAFDTLNDAQGEGAYNSDDYEYNLSLTKEGPEVSSSHGETKDLIKKIKVSIKRKDNKIYYEAAFPWLSLKPFNPDINRDMGFNLTVMDNDGDEAKFPKFKGFHQYLQITHGIVTGKQPALFPDLILIK